METEVSGHIDNLDEATYGDSREVDECATKEDAIFSLALHKSHHTRAGADTKDYDDTTIFIANEDGRLYCKLDIITA